MILRRLKDAIRRQDWFAVGLEVIIVVVGVLIALAANDYAARQMEREFEVNALQELKSALLSDLKGSNIDFELHQEAARNTSWLREHIVQKRPYSDTLGQYFWSVRQATIWAQDEAAYQTLQQKGMSTIQNDSLRIAIGRHYGYNRQSVLKLQDGIRDYITLNVVPFYHRHFVDRFTPADYEQLLESTEYKYLLDYAGRFQSSVTGLLEQSISETNALIAMIENELQERGP